MGILNITPDSFFDGGFYLDRNKAIERGLKLVSEGADIIDIGGESSRPGSESIPTDEELRRIIPVISEIRKRAHTLISVDTTKSQVAQAALDAGADIINDISSFRFDSDMLRLAIENDVPLILMHMKGIPRTMQINPGYENVLSEVKDFLQERIKTATAGGIKKEKIIIDPGIGFGKRIKDNLALIKNLQFLSPLDRPIMVGVSRKSFIGKILNLPPEERIEGSIAASVISIINGAHILRTHDVAALRRAVHIAENIMDENLNPQSFEDKEEKKGSYVH